MYASNKRKAKSCPLFVIQPGFTMKKKEQKIKKKRCKMIMLSYFNFTLLTSSSFANCTPQKIYFQLGFITKACTTFNYSWQIYMQR